MKGSKIKGRSSITYNRKAKRMKKWYAKLEKNRELREATAKKEGKELKVMPLKPLSFYIDSIKAINNSKQ